MGPSRKAEKKSEPRDWSTGAKKGKENLGVFPLKTGASERKRGVGSMNKGGVDYKEDVARVSLKGEGGRAEIGQGNGQTEEGEIAQSSIPESIGGKESWGRNDD